MKRQRRLVLHPCVQPESANSALYTVTLLVVSAYGLDVSRPRTVSSRRRRLPSDNQSFGKEKL